MEYTKILCYDIRYKKPGIKAPNEVEVQVILPETWRFDYVPAKQAVKAVLESVIKLEVLTFEWRPI